MPYRKAFNFPIGIEIEKYSVFIAVYVQFQRVFTIEKELLIKKFANT